jgi:hypothetical protein
MLSIFSKLEIILRTKECKVNETSKMEKKWSDIVAGRNIYIYIYRELKSIQNTNSDNLMDFTGNKYRKKKEWN